MVVVPVSVARIPVYLKLRPFPSLPRTAQTSSKEGGETDDKANLKDYCWISVSLGKDGTALNGLAWTVKLPVTERT